MPSRSNPNTPASLKRKTASTLQSKRQRNQRLARNKVSKPTPRTSQALRQAAPLSNKKARKLEKKMGYAQRRKMGQMGEVEMKDADVVKTNKEGKDVENGEKDDGGMELDGAE